MASALKTFRLVIGYDGTEFHGWQVQPGARTVQGEIERVLQELLQLESLRIHGAGRTDAGVHARGQVASFECETALPAAAIAAEAPAGYQAGLSARARCYAYRLLERDDVPWRRFAWRPALRWDAGGLARATEALEGEHDFAAFESTGSSETVTRCALRRARWSGWEGGLRFDVEADHFLYHMVRNIVGTALQRSCDPDPAAAMRDILASGDRRRAGLTAPACGLTLERVVYPEDAS